MPLGYSEINNTNYVKPKKRDVLKDTNCPLTRGICKHYYLKHGYKSKKVLNEYGEEVETFYGIGDRVENAFLGGSKAKSKASTEDIDNSLDKTTNEQITENFKKNMSSVVQKNCTDVANESKQEMLIEIAAANVLSINGAKTKGKFSLKNVSQKNDVKVEAKMSAENKATTKITTSASSSTTNQLTDIMKDEKKMGESLTALAGKGIDAAAGMVNNTVDNAAGVFNNYTDTAGDVAEAGIGAVAGVATAAIDGVTGGSKSVSTDDKTVDNSKKIVENLNHDINSEIIENSLNSSMENSVNTKSLQACGAKIAGDNTISLENIEADEGIEIDGISQENVIVAIIDCQFSNEVCNEIVTDFMNEVENSEEFKKLSIEEQEGFGAALGAAAEGVGTGIAEAAEGVGDGLATTAEGVGDGLATTAEGVGSMFGSMTYLLIGCCIFLVIGILGFTKMGGIGQAANAAKAVKGF